MARVRLSLFVVLVASACAPREASLPLGDGAVEGFTDGGSTNDDGWEIASEAAVGVDAARLAELDSEVARGTYRPDGLVVVKDGLVVRERYWNGHSPATLHDLRSATKSFTSALVGVAIDLGALSLDTKVTSLLAARGPFQSPDPRKDAIEVRHLLQMQSGLACDDWNTASAGNEERMYPHDDWVRFTLDLPMARDPGKASAYCTGGVVVLGAVVAHATKRPIPELAAQELFGKLDIREARWDHAPNGETDTGGHLHLRPRDFAKLGQLFLDGGTWRGRRVLSRDWVERSIAPRDVLGDARYGYLWWSNTFTVAGTPVEVTFARGNGGQYVFFVPAYRLVAAFVGSAYGGKGSSDPIEMFGKYVLRSVVK